MNLPLLLKQQLKVRVALLTFSDVEKGNRTFIISVESKKSLARWVLSIDGLKHLATSKFQSVLDLSLKVVKVSLSHSNRKNFLLNCT